jgi:uncharacterized membrane protein HdeD (DUF308 family)
VQFTLARVQKAMGGRPVWSIIGGILSLALAVAAIVYPGLTVATVILLIAWFALALGVVQLVIAFLVRSLTTAVVSAAPR